LLELVVIELVEARAIERRRGARRIVERSQNGLELGSLQVVQLRKLLKR